MIWLVRGCMFALGFLFGSWMSSSDALHALGGQASRFGDEIDRWETRRDERLAKMIARELRTEP